MKRNKLNLLIVVLVGLAAVIGCGKSDEEKQRDAERRDKPAKFAAARNQFATKPSKIALVTQPYLKGKVVMLGKTEKGEFGYQTSPALTALEAMTPDEVGTIILKECRSTQKGVYRTNDNPPRELPAIAIDCEVSLIEKTAQIVYFSKVFQGKLSEEASVSKVSDSVASGPDEEINAFLAGLPRR